MTPDAQAKTHFVVVDCVGQCETELGDTQPLERRNTVPFGALLKGTCGCRRVGEALLSLLAGRLARLDRQCDVTRRTVAVSRPHQVAQASLMSPAQSSRPLPRSPGRAGTTPVLTRRSRLAPRG